MAERVLRVKDIMSRDVRTLGRNDRLAVADALMQQDRIRHLPVLDGDGVVCGVVSQRDLFRGALLRALGYGGRAEDRLLNQVLVKEAMSAELYTASPDMPVAEAAREMIERKIGCLPVVDGEKLVGIMTETDLVRLVSEGRAPRP
ncbi:MAG: CBS domain-containing protein [Burkholderiales bacterium]